jgi:hypothetical protein
MIQGARYSVGRLVVFAALYVFFFVLLAVSTLSTVVALWGVAGYALAAVYAAVVIASAHVARPFVHRRVRFEERSDGSWYYRLPVVVPALYLVLFVVRFAVEIVALGPSFLSSPFNPPSVSTSLVAVLIGIDLMFGVSSGILVGRSQGVYRAYQTRPTSSPGMSSGTLEPR